MTRSMRWVAESLGAPVGCVLEGGYDLGALARSVAATLAALREPVSADGPAESSASSDPAVVSAALERMSEWWPALR